MNPVLAEIQSAASGAALEVLKELGSTIQYSHAGGAPVTLYAAPAEANTDQAAIMGVRTNQTTIVFNVPAQPNFPPLDTNNLPSVTPQDWIQPNGVGVQYTVKSIVADPVGASYAMTAVQRKAKQAS